MLIKGVQKAFRILFVITFILLCKCFNYFYCYWEMDIFFERLKKARAHKGLSQERMAEMCDVSLPSYRKYEQGVTAKFPLDVAQLFAEATGTSLHWLATGEGAMLGGGSPSAGINRDELSLILETLFDTMAKKNKKVSNPENLVEAVFLIYDMVHDTSGETKINRDNIIDLTERLMKVAS